MCGVACACLHEVCVWAGGRDGARAQPPSNKQAQEMGWGWVLPSAGKRGECANWGEGGGGAGKGGREGCSRAAGGGGARRPPRRPPPGLSHSRVVMGGGGGGASRGGLLHAHGQSAEREGAKVRSRPGAQAGAHARRRRTPSPHPSPHTHTRTRAHTATRLEVGNQIGALLWLLQPSKHHLGACAACVRVFGWCACR